MLFALLVVIALLLWIGLLLRGITMTLQEFTDQVNTEFVTFNQTVDTFIANHPAPAPQDFQEAFNVVKQSLDAVAAKIQ